MTDVARKTRLGNRLREIAEISAHKNAQTRLDTVWTKLKELFEEHATCGETKLFVKYEQMDIKTLAFLDPCYRKQDEQMLLDLIVAKCNEENLVCTPQTRCDCDTGTMCRCIANGLWIEFAPTGLSNSTNIQ